MVKDIKDKKKRRRHPVDEKVAILRRHLVDRVPVSDLCDEYKIQPSVFYGWHRQLIDNLGVALEAGGKKSDSRTAELERKNEALEQQLAKKDAVIAKKDGVIAEVSAEYVALKKQLGEP
jgi:transposase-like protein